MVSAFLRAIGDALAPRQSRALLLSIGIALGALALLWGGATIALHAASFFSNPWFEAPLEFVGSLAVLLLAWLLFPAVVTFVLSFFLDGIVARLERQHYPDLPPPRVGAAGALFRGALRLLGLSVLLNLAILPFYLLPPIIPLVYYGLNGYLLGREYFELIALRRLERRVARSVWRRHRSRLFPAGVVIAFLLTLPVVNLAAPLVAAAFMLHLFEGLRRGEAPPAGSYGPVADG